MSAQDQTFRVAIVSLAVLAVVFAPATHEGLVGTPEIPADDVDARILAPTVREAVVSVGPKLSAGQFQAARQGSGPGSLPFAVPAAIGLLLLLTLSWAARPLSIDGARRLLDPFTRVARGPPGLQTT